MFCCDNCGFSTSYKSSMERHKNMVKTCQAKIKLYICDKCGKGFNSKQRLDYHLFERKKKCISSIDEKTVQTISTDNYSTETKEQSIQTDDIKPITISETSNQDLYQKIIREYSDEAIIYKNIKGVIVDLARRNLFIDPNPNFIKEKITYILDNMNEKWIEKFIEEINNKKSDYKKYIQEYIQDLESGSRKNEKRINGKNKDLHIAILLKNIL